MSNQYIERVIEDCKKNNPGEVEFHQTVEEVLFKLPIFSKFDNLIYIFFKNCSFFHIQPPPHTYKSILFLGHFFKN